MTSNDKTEPGFAFELRKKRQEMESYEQGYDVDRFEYAVSQNFHCPICLNVFKDPVMCQRNQHFFCRPCITRHLTNSPTCPSCKEKLTLETLTPAPRIVTGCLSELNIRCDYSNRGCRDFVQLGNLENHVKNCGFTPVVCSNEGCLVEINKRDRTHHETEVCEFRKVQCHNCAELNKEMDKVKTKLMAVQNETGELKISLKAVNEKLIKLDEMEDIKANLTEIKEQLGHLATLPDQLYRGIQTMQEKIVKEIQGMKIDGTNVKDSVVIAGGCIPDRYGILKTTNSVETYNCSKKSWPPLQSMKECREEASAVIYKDQIIAMGGRTNHGPTDSMESLAINHTMDSAQWFDFPAKLPGTLLGHSSVVYNGRLIVIGGRDDRNYSDSIHEVSLDPPYTNKLLTGMPEPRGCHGAELFNDKMLIVGGRKSDWFKDSVDSVLMYDINKNQCKQMAPLPFAVCEMATVSWGDSLIVIGGADKGGKALNTVVIYNVQTEKSHMLPAMKYKRNGCAAVVTGNAILVMGGVDEGGHYLDSVESFSFDRYSWKDLPPMNEARWQATAVAW